MEKLLINNNQEDLIELIKLVNEENKIYELEGVNASAVLISQKDYQSLQETVELLSISGLKESLQLSLQQISDHETYSLDDVLGDTH